MIYDRHRPKTLDQIIGCDNAKAAIRSALQHRDPTWLLITGPSGTGKTSLALCAAAEAHADPFFDFRRIDSRLCTIPALLDLESWLLQHPARGTHKITLIDEAHQITQGAADYLLGLTERTPDANIIIATTTERQPYSPILMSRWLTIPLDPPDPSEATAWLLEVAKQEGRALNPATLPAAIAARHGNLRACLTEIVEQGKIF